MDKYVKMAAIEKIAKPMAAFHGKDYESTEEDMSHADCKCKCCGAPCEICSEGNSENEEEKDSEEY